MKPLVCELCGGTDIVKNDGLFVCQHCGCKYTLEEAQQLILDGSVDVSGSTVKIDAMPAIESLLLRARQFYGEGDAPKAIEYLNRILDMDAKNQEAADFLKKIQRIQREKKKAPNEPLKKSWKMNNEES